MKNPYSVEELQRIIGTAQGLSATSEPEPVVDEFAQEYGTEAAPAEEPLALGPPTVDWFNSQPPQDSGGPSLDFSRLNRGRQTEGPSLRDWVDPQASAPQQAAPPVKADQPQQTQGTTADAPESAEAKERTLGEVEEEGEGSGVEPARLRESPSGPAKPPPVAPSKYVFSGLPDQRLPPGLRAAFMENEMAGQLNRKSADASESARASVANRALEAATREEELSRKIRQDQQARIQAQKEAASRAERAEMIAGIFDSVGQLFEDQKQYNTTIMAAAFAGAGKPELAVELVKSAQNQNYLAQRNAIDRARMRGQRADNALERMRQAAGDEHTGDLLYKQATLAATQKQLAAMADLDMSPARKLAIQAAYRSTEAQRLTNKYEIEKAITSSSTDPVMTSAFNTMDPDGPEYSAAKIGTRAGYTKEGRQAYPERVAVDFAELEKRYENDPEMLKRIKADKQQAWEYAAFSPEAKSAREVDAKRAETSKILQKSASAHIANVSVAGGKSGKGKGTPVQELTALEDSVYGRAIQSIADGERKQLPPNLEMKPVSSSKSGGRALFTLAPKDVTLYRVGSQQYLLPKGKEISDENLKALSGNIMDPNAAARGMLAAYDNYAKTAEEIRAGKLSMEKGAPLLNRYASEYSARATFLSGKQFKELFGVQSEREAEKIAKMVPSVNAKTEGLESRLRNMLSPSVADAITPSELNRIRNNRGALQGYVEAVAAEEPGRRRYLQQRYGLVPTRWKDTEAKGKLGKVNVMVLSLE